MPDYELKFEQYSRKGGEPINEGRLIVRQAPTLPDALERGLAMVNHNENVMQAEPIEWVSVIRLVTPD